MIDDFADHFVNDTGRPGDGCVRVTSLGSTVMLVDDGTIQIMIDAFISPAGMLDAFLLGMATDEQAVDDVLQRVDAARVAAIFISHSHHDHALDVAYVAQRTGATIFGSSSTHNIARRGRLRRDQLKALDIGAPLTVGKFAVQTFPSMHSLPVLGGEGATIDEPLRRRARVLAYKEGGTFDFLVTNDDHRMLFKSSANYRPRALDGVKVDVLFLGIAGLGRASEPRARDFLDATVGSLEPRLIVPTHWNDLFRPATAGAPLQRKFIDNTARALDRVIAYSTASGHQIAILDSFSSILLGSSRPDGGGEWRDLPRE